MQGTLGLEAMVARGEMLYLMAILGQVAAVVAVALHQVGLAPQVGVLWGVGMVVAVVAFHFQLFL